MNKYITLMIENGREFEYSIEVKNLSEADFRSKKLAEHNGRLYVNVRPLTRNRE